MERVEDFIFSLEFLDEVMNLIVSNHDEKYFKKHHEGIEAGVAAAMVVIQDFIIDMR